MKTNSFYESGTSYLFFLRYVFGLFWVKGVNEVFYIIHTLSLLSGSTAYVVIALCISRDSDLAQCSYQSNQFNQNLSW